MIGEPFREALAFAVRCHGDQHRKGKPDVPYVSHLLGVAAIVVEAGGTETEAVAALLHDVIEDTSATPDDVRRRFGPHVLAIVLGCTDDLVAPGDEPADGMTAPTRGAADWHDRKTAYLDHLRNETDPGTLLVSAADKLHNARALVADLRVDDTAWTPFNAPPTQQLWYYTTLRDVLAGRVCAAIDHELRATVADIERLTNLEVATAALVGGSSGRAYRCPLIPSSASERSARSSAPPPATRSARPSSSARPAHTANGSRSRSSAGSASRSVVAASAGRPVSSPTTPRWRSCRPGPSWIAADSTVPTCSSGSECGPAPPPTSASRRTPRSSSGLPWDEAARDYFARNPDRLGRQRRV